MNNKNFSVDDILDEVREKRKNGGRIYNKYDFTYNNDNLSSLININKNRQTPDKNNDFEMDSENVLINFDNENEILKESDVEQDTKINIMEESNLDEMTFKVVSDLNNFIETTPKEKLKKKQLWETNEFVNNRSSAGNNNLGFLTHTLNDFFRPEFSPNNENIREKSRDVVQNLNDNTKQLDETEEVKNSVDYVLNSLIKEKKTLWLQLTVSIVSFLALIWLFMVNVIPSKLPNSLVVVPLQLNSVIINTTFTLIPAVLCSELVIGGFIRIFKFKANGDSLISLTVLSSLMQSCIWFFNPYFAISEYGFNIYSAIAIMSLIFNLINKLMVNNVNLGNTNLLNNDIMEFTPEILDNNLAEQVKYVTGLKGINICFAQKLENHSKFLKTTFQKDDYFDKVCHTLVPIIGAVSLCLMTYLIFDKDIIFSSSVFAGFLAISSSFVGNLGCSMCLFNLSKKLRRVKAGVYSLDALKIFENTDALMLKSEDLIFSTHILLSKMELFDEKNIDIALQNTASILSEAKAEIADLFINMLGDKSMLKVVEGLNYEGNMGFSGWIDDKRTLFGTRELMINHGIRIPSRDFEKIRLTEEPGKLMSRALYMASNGILVALFIITHKPVLKVRRALAKIQKQKFIMLISSRDPTISADFISVLYGLDINNIWIIPKCSRNNSNVTDNLQYNARTDILLSDRLFGLTLTSQLAQKIKNTEKTSVILQICGIILGIGLILYFVFAGDFKHVSVLNILMYNLLWLGVSLLLPSIKGI